MAYKLDKTKKLQEQLDLGGTIIDIEIDVMAIAKDFNILYNKVFLLQSQHKGEFNPKATEEIGLAFLELCDITFGKEKSNLILDFYENNYLDMVLNLVPFFNEIVVPAIKKFTKEKQKEAAEKYKAKQRRKFGK